MIPCISIAQPWAWAICQGLKRVENRTWTTRHRGQIVIHAGKRRDLYDEVVRLASNDPPYPNFPENVRAARALTERGLPPFDDLPRGAFVATAVLECIFDARDPRNNVRSIDPLFAFGPSCWVLSNVKPLAKPVPGIGHQALWEAPDELLAEIGMLASRPDGQR
jgi:hypothetical protein